jgi:hypothetical protein
VVFLFSWSCSTVSTLPGCPPQPRVTSTHVHATVAQSVWSFGDSVACEWVGGSARTSMRVHSTPAVLSLLWSVAFEFLNLLLSLLGVQACVPPWQHVQHVSAFIAVVINTWVDDCTLFFSFPIWFEVIVVPIGI